jgi:hypothetical protein
MRTFACQVAVLVGCVLGIGTARLGGQASAERPRPRTGLVQLDGHVLKDDHGHFNGLGVTYMPALWRAKHDRARLRSDLDFLSRCGFHYVRVLSMVGWYSAWEGKEIAPVSFQNRNRQRVEAWPDYWQQLGELVDIAYDEFGLRTQLTIFADAQLMPQKSSRIDHMDRILGGLRGREHKVILLEVANEAWQNGFAGPQGIADLREFGKYLNDRTKVLVALSAPENYANEGILEMYRDSAADIATVHLSRDTRTPQGGWLSVRDPWRVQFIDGIPPVSSNEPIGPGSSVAAENDPIKLLCAASFAWMSGLPMYVYHSEAGVFGRSRFQDQPAIERVGRLLDMLPSDLGNWRRFDGDTTDAPLRLLGQRAHGLPHMIACTKGDQLVALAFGIGDSPVQLGSGAPVQAQIFDPATNQRQWRSLGKGDRFELAPGGAAYLIKAIVASN